ncbi:MAG: hypothetical protein HDR11_17070 [Lachnospiraceae bacterium]|nr:hypothetical protein [Lachnospiraceae bacterium]
MKENNLIKKSGKNDFKLRKLNLYKDSAITAMDNISDFGKKVLDTNNEYLEKLCKADQPEYNILLENLKIANSEDERTAIRARMAEMKKERYQKDTENKEFCDRQRENHKHSILQIVGSVAVITGVVAYKFRKPLMEASKKLITKE